MNNLIFYPLSLYWIWFLKKYQIIKSVNSLIMPAFWPSKKENLLQFQWYFRECFMERLFNPVETDDLKWLKIVPEFQQF